jgi:hypothetical protein
MPVVGGFRYWELKLTIVLPMPESELVDFEWPLAPEN